MDRSLYKRWHDHPLRSLLRRAAQGAHIYGDELDDLRLPPKVRRATEEAIERVRQQGAPRSGRGSADDYSSELVAALPEHHETREQHEARRAEAGDAEALSNRKAQEEARDRMADKILTEGAAHS